MLKAVLFDLDGTLLDTATDFTRVLNGLLNEHQRPLQHYEAVRRRVSDGARAVVNLGFGIDPDHPDFAALLAAFLDRYETQIAVETTLFPGMDAQLRKLEAQGLKWGIVTNKPSRFTEPLLRALDLDGRCGSAICPDHVTHRKPDPEPIYLACKELGVNPKEAVYVGDHRRDIDAGRNAGMATIACAFGYISEGESVEDWLPDYIIHHADELETVLAQHRKKLEEAPCP
ncbi:HAD-IA family hydrolase [Spongiibacter sp. KMU-166]|uniref:HAD-IA family hydrolase n=1 Tax=Spongiibacter thalassae TaxID=2721624 RepID=A0ABX1GD49_9GAMM|nr:HAD-IA family hydrolase [Spongiibacter thalassae]NKI16861.1 HAD-IA family hydrolase [Spongiibacter thalassae]